MIKVLHIRLDGPRMFADILTDRETGASYREVAAFPIDELGLKDDAPDGVVLERVYRTMNCVDGDPVTEICVRNRVRSMMVGDRVVLPRGTTYQCCEVGWKTVSV